VRRSEQIRLKLEQLVIPPGESRVSSRYVADEAVSVGRIALNVIQQSEQIRPTDGD
jgi:hypothetical protein